MRSAYTRMLQHVLLNNLSNLHVRYSSVLANRYINMPNSISAPFGALVSNTKVRARNRHRRRHAGHEQGGDLSTIVSAETEAETKGDEEVVPILNCPDDAGLLWEEEDDYESVEQLKCDSGMFDFFFQFYIRVLILIHYS